MKASFQNSEKNYTVSHLTANEIINLSYDTKLAQLITPITFWRAADLAISIIAPEHTKAWETEILFQVWSNQIIVKYEGFFVELKCDSDFNKENEAARINALLSSYHYIQNGYNLTIKSNKGMPEVFLKEGESISPLVFYFGTNGDIEKSKQLISIGFKKSKESEFGVIAESPELHKEPESIKDKCKYVSEILSYTCLKLQEALNQKVSIPQQGAAQAVLPF